MQESVNGNTRADEIKQWQSLYDEMARIPVWKLPPITRERFPEKKIYSTNQDEIGNITHSLHAQLSDPKGWSARLFIDSALQPVTLSRVPEKDSVLSVTFDYLHESIYRSQLACWLDCTEREIEIHNILEKSHELFTITNIVDVEVDPYLAIQTKKIKSTGSLRVSFFVPASDFSYQLEVENESPISIEQASDMIKSFADALTTK